MEYANSVWQISIIALVAGVMIGALAYRLLSSSDDQIDKIKSELDSTKRERDEYKANVNQHFNKTSELVSDLTQDFVKVYQHLAEGAQNLGDSKALTDLLEQHQGKVSIAIENETSVTDEITSKVINESEEVPDTSAEAIDEHAEPYMGTDGSEPDSSHLDGDVGSSDESLETPVSETETETAKVKPEPRNITG